MNPIDLILNAAAVLLWAHARSMRLSGVRSRSGTLLSTLVKAGNRTNSGWFYWLGLVVLLLLRAVFYWHMGSAAEWIAVFRAGPLTIPFRSDFAGRMFLFSFLSFGRMLLFFYCCLLLVSAVNRRLADSDPIQKMAKAQLGLLDRLPAAVKLALPLPIAAACWMGLNPILVRLELLPPAQTTSLLAQQSLVIGAGAFYAWELPIVVLMMVHAVNSYVFLGNSAFWTFVHATAENLLKPIRWLPLRAGKLDLAPIAAIGIVIAAHFLAEPVLANLYQRLPIWR